MATWDEIRRFLIEERSAKENGDVFIVTVSCPEGRGQVVAVRAPTGVDIVLESPFARVSEQTKPLEEVLRFVSKESFYGIRITDDFLSLTTVGLLATTERPDLDYLLDGIAFEADGIEYMLSRGDDSF